MSGNDFLGAFYEKPQKPYGFSWLEGVQTGQEPENPAASATVPSPGENSFHSFYCTKGADITSNHASVLSGIRQNPSAQALFGEHQLNWNLQSQCPP